MLSYQHAYHAGCLADVHKHAAQLIILEAVIRDAPRLTYVETHSGRGLYRLDSAEANKTGEAKEGILRLLREDRLPPELAYTKALRQVQRHYGKQAYPGSPLLAQMTLRPQDALHCFELHPAEHAALCRHLKGRNLRVYKQDGYVGLARLARGKRPQAAMVVIDPSFEVKAEYEQAAQAVWQLSARWPGAVLLLWYPLLKAGHHAGMLEVLEAEPLPGYWHQQVRFHAPGTVRGMYGSGLVAVNLLEEARASLEALPGIFPPMMTKETTPIHARARQSSLRHTKPVPKQGKRPRP